MTNLMTNYNERLDEILAKHGAEPGEMTHSLKQAITSLTKELVAEAKPGYDAVKNSERDKAINEFEQNLLKALEEV